MVRSFPWLAFFLVGACVGGGHRARSSALGQQDGALGDALFDCGPIGYQGCCVGDTLRYCAGGQLVSQNCAPAGHCGWDPLFAVYGCGASSAADPGGLPRACPASDAGPLPDRGADIRLAADSNTCGKVAYAGCCLGTELFFCAGGKLLGLDCSTNPFCGWDNTKLYYTCGTDGQTDPSGVHPKACAGLPLDAGPSDAHREARPDLPWPDLVADGLAEAGSDATGDAGRPVERGRDRLATESSGLDPSGLEVSRRDSVSSSSQGCGCAVAARPTRAALASVVLCLGALLLLGGRRRVLLVGLMGLGLALLAGCTEPGSTASGQRRPFGAGDAAAADWAAGEGEGAKGDAGCSPAWEGGCCQGETLWWCENGTVKSLDCRDRPHCGWSDSKQYDCNTSGIEDPTHRLAQHCSARGVKIPDGGTVPTSCRGVSVEGCCAGQVLVYCAAGELRSISCAQNLFCGWRGAVYNCGTSGDEGPSGHPRQCPAGLADTGPQRWEGIVGPADSGRFDLVEAKLPPGDGCSCEIGHGAGSGALFLVLVLVLVIVLGSPRRTN